MAAASVLRASPEKDLSSPAEIPFQRYFVEDQFGRRVTFYLERETSIERLPLSVFILGSGSASNFLINKGRILHAHRAFLKALHGRSRLLVVEKVGVEFGGQPTRPGTSLGSSEEFRREHTFERWVAAVTAAMNAARTLNGIDPASALVVGHSEGALVAAGVAARNAFVTHVACLAGSAATQLYSFLQEARLGRLESLGGTPDQQIEGLLRKWEEIVLHAPDPNRMWLGHAYPRWATFMRRSVLEELQQSRAAIFVAIGSEDGVDPAASVDLLHAGLLSRGKDVTAVLVQGANHGFQFPADKTRDGWAEILNRIADWFANTSEPLSQ